MERPLDLLLLTDEVTDAETNKFTRANFLVFVASAHELGFAAADDAAVRERFKLREYWVSPKDRAQAGFMDPFGFVMPHRPSLALCDLATVAKREGYSAVVVDNFLRYAFRQEQARRIIEAGKPRLIGISTTLIVSNKAIQEFIAIVRELSPTSRIVLGGPTVRREDTVHALADFCVFGAGEGPIVGILEALDGKRSLDSVPYLAYRDDAGTMCYTDTARQHFAQLGKAYRIQPDTRIPVPDWTLYPRSSDSVYPIEFSRGCKYNCFYCGYDRGKLVRDLDEVRAELLKNAALGIRKYRFGDSNFTDGPPSYPRYPHDVCKLMIELDLGLEWSCYARVDDLTPELADLMKRAGCFGVFFGVESGDDRILKLMRKGHDVEDARKGIRVAKSAGLYVHSNFIIGYPGETAETCDNTIAFIESTGADTITIGQFFAEDHTPVRGPAMAAFNLQGAATTWSHSTMDSATADGLIRKALARLNGSGVTIGSEYEIAGMMAVGLSFEECLRTFALRRQVMSRGAPPDQRKAAREWLRDLYTERFPKMIAGEQRLMTGAG